MPINGWSIKLFWGLSFEILSFKCQLCHLHCREEVVLVLKKNRYYLKATFFEKMVSNCYPFCSGVFNVKVKQPKKVGFYAVVSEVMCPLCVCGELTYRFVYYRSILVHDLELYC